MLKAGGGNDREVVFRLKAVPDDSNQQALSRFGKAMDEAQKKLDVSSGNGARRRAKTEQQTLEETAATAKKLDREVASERAKLLDQELKDARRKREDFEKSRIKLMREAERDTELAMGRIRAANASMIEGFNMGTEGLLKLGRGFTLLGLVGEEETKKILQTLLKVQAVIDLTRGSIELYRGITRAVQGYRAAVLAAAAAENVLATARFKTAMAGGLGAGGAAGGAAAGGVAAVGTGGTIAAAAAALAGVAAAGVAVIDTFRGIRENGLGGGARAGSFSDRVGTVEAGLAARWSRFVNSILGEPQIETSFTQLGRSQERTESVERRLQRDRADRARREEQAQINLRGQAQLRAMRASSAEMMLGFDPRVRDLQGNRRALEVNQIESGQTRRDLRGARADLMGAKTESDRLDAERRIVDLQDRAANLTARRLEIEKQITDERRRSVDEAIAGTERELDLRRQIVRAEEDRLKSAKERFGQLDPFEQQRLIQIKQRADQGQELTRQERAALRGVGTSAAEDIASRGDIAAAERAGFERFFGQDERDRVTAAQQQSRQLELQLRDQRDLKVVIEEDEQQLVNRLAGLIRSQLAERDKRLEKMIEERVEQAQGEANQRQDAAASIRGRQ